MSLSVRRVWIEMSVLYDLRCKNKSLSARRVWIEIVPIRLIYYLFFVTLCEESVD